MNTDSAPEPTPQQQAFIWWVIWFAILGGSIVIYFVLGVKGARTPPAAVSPLAFVGIGPLVISMVLRWLVMPNVTERKRGLALFVTGLALAESATILATFLGRGETRDAIAIAGILGVAVWAPVFAADIMAADREA